MIYFKPTPSKKLKETVWQVQDNFRHIYLLQKLKQVLMS